MLKGVGKIRMARINDAILAMISSGTHVWVSTDWHAVKWDKKTHEIYKRPEYDDIMKKLRCITPDDVFIYLGDIIDSEITSAKYIDEIMKHVNTEKRILVLGNNDRQDPEYYGRWFTYVVNVILLPEERVVLSHCPIDTKEKIVIHGHVHEEKHKLEPGYTWAGHYWDTYSIQTRNHVNAFTYPHHPIELSVLMRRKPNPFVQHVGGVNKPYTADLVQQEHHDYKILREYYDRLEGA